MVHCFCFSFYGKVCVVFYEGPNEKDGGSLTRVTCSNWKGTLLLDSVTQKLGRLLTFKKGINT